MSTKYQALTEKEKQTLRLILRGHDAKSMARHLNLSVHTINERLRDARRKLEVSSSREAARQLLERESLDPDLVGDKQLGDVCSASGGDRDTPSTIKRLSSRRALLIAGVFIMSIFTAVIALSAITTGTTPAATGEADPPNASIESDAVRAARDWLVLGDQGRWKDGWLATAESFRKANSVDQWADAATKVRLPMGALISRKALGQESVPAPPNGVEVIKFRASFANRPNVIETVSLIREGGSWRVVGIYVD